MTGKVVCCRGPKLALEGLLEWSVQEHEPPSHVSAARKSHRQEKAHACGYETLELISNSVVQKSHDGIGTASLMSGRTMALAWAPAPPITVSQM